MIRRLATLFALAAVCAPPATASVIDYSTRLSASGPLGSAAEYRALVESLTASPPSPGFGDARGVAAFDGLTNQGRFGGGATAIASRFLVTFEVPAALAGLWSFRFGVDFGNGGAVFLDGAALDFRNTDMFANGSYADPTQFLAGAATLAAGVHRIAVYGLESCCDGPNQGQYLAPGATGWVTFSATDGLTPRVAPVPAPAAAAAFGLGLLGLAPARRRGVAGRA